MVLYHLYSTSNTAKPPSKLERGLHFIVYMGVDTHPCPELNTILAKKLIPVNS